MSLRRFALGSDVGCGWLETESVVDHGKCWVSAIACGSSFLVIYYQFGRARASPSECISSKVQLWCAYDQLSPMTPWHWRLRCLSKPSNCIACLLGTWHWCNRCTDLPTVAPTEPIAPHPRNAPLLSLLKGITSISRGTSFTLPSTATQVPLSKHGQHPARHSSPLRIALPRPRLWLFTQPNRIRQFGTTPMLQSFGNHWSGAIARPERASRPFNWECHFLDRTIGTTQSEYSPWSSAQIVAKTVRNNCYRW